MNPQVSIVFTSYNHKVFLQQAIDSLLCQTYKDYELIIVDDKSTDGSQEIIKKYSNVPNVRIFLRENNSGSYVKASNYGARFAIGKYILFAQCDDYAEPTQLQILVKALEDNPDVGVSFSRSTLVNEKGETIGDDYKIREKSFRENCISDTIIPKSLMRGYLSKSCVIPNLSAALIIRDMYTEVGGLSEDYLVAADWAFWLSLAEKTHFFYITAPLNNFRQHDTTIRKTIKIKRQILEIYTIFYNHIKEYKLTGKSRYQFRIGAATVWLSYLRQNVKTWLLSFPSLLISTFKYDKKVIVYLFVGAYIKVKEFITYDQNDA